MDELVARLADGDHPVVVGGPAPSLEQLQQSIDRGYVPIKFTDTQGGTELGLTPETLARITAPPRTSGERDEVLGVPSYFSLGFLRPGPHVLFGSSPRAFGAPGAGGSFGFADPDQHLGYAYVMNKLDFYLTDDPREKPLRDAIYRAIATVGSARRATTERAAAAPLHV